MITISRILLVYLCKLEQSDWLSYNRNLVESTFRNFADVKVSEVSRAQVSEERAARPSEFKDQKSTNSVP